MTKIFGLVVCFALCLQSANGALLLSYRFQAPGTGTNTVTNLGATYDGVLSSTQIVATTFSNIGAPGTVNGLHGSVQPTSGGNIDRYWSTSNNVTATFQTNRYNEFTITNPGLVYSMTVDSIALAAWRNAGTGTAATGRVSVQYSLNSGTGGNDTSTFASNSAISVSHQLTKPAQSSLSLTTPVTLLAGESMKIRFIYDRSTNTGTDIISRFRLDDIQLSGSFVQDPPPVVPEPLSIATFGLVGAGLALARRRKRS
jgi:hypothetical protein